jgi:ComF family protein
MGHLQKVLLFCRFEGFNPRPKTTERTNLSGIKGIFLQVHFYHELNCPHGEGVSMRKISSLANPGDWAWSREWLDLLLPRLCVACGLVSKTENLCDSCAAELPRNHLACRYCGLKLSVCGDSVCGHCLKKPPPWQFAIAALDYCFPVSQLACRFKFRRDLACGQALGMQLITAIEQADYPLPKVIIPVPLHRSRHFLRSFNQAELLARQVGKSMHLPVQSGLLFRKRRTRAQSGLDARERRKNTHAAFISRQSRYRHVALVDDVMTTGATLAECTRTLQQAGVGCVSVWVAARAHTGQSQS